MVSEKISYKGIVTESFNALYIISERGKKKDQRGEFSQALNFYEDGMSLLLEAATSNVEEESEENTQHLRFKCLLIHERIEAIRNHLDSGLPIKVSGMTMRIFIK